MQQPLALTVRPNPKSTRIGMTQVIAREDTEDWRCPQQD